MTTAKSCCFIQDKNIEINNKTAKRKATWVFPIFRTDKPSFFLRFNEESESRLSDSSLNPLKKDGLSVQNIWKIQVAFLFAVLLFRNKYV